MTEYGLPTSRDNEGNRKPVDHSYEYDGDDITIKLLPPTISEIEEYENLDDNVNAAQLRDILDTHLVRPEQEDYTIDELWAYYSGILEYALDGNTSELAAEAEQRLDERADEGEGN